ncbi:conserved hypothetical protein [Ricinus communis]|uniref:Uncharacterized protein n=1 Tax=Ricinus communis TaxID=3988 RepID=B9S3T1_RICCO|nr:conserved hypothetical protein [Ricinus communis]
METLEKIGVDVRFIPRPAYSKPYPNWVDKLLQFSRNYKILKFILFAREEDTQSTLEHVAKSSVQYAEVGANDFLKLRQPPKECPALRKPRSQKDKKKTLRATNLMKDILLILLRPMRYLTGLWKKVK